LSPETSLTAELEVMKNLLGTRYIASPWRYPI